MISPCGCTVEMLRSCHSSEWQFYRNAPEVRTPGRFYFVAEDTPALPWYHDFFSATWTENTDDPPRLTGPVQDAARPWNNGRMDIAPPPAVPLGSSFDFERGLTYPEQQNSAELRAGVPVTCWTQAGAAFLPFDPVADLTSCPLRLAYARVIDCLYNSEDAVIVDFFAEWLGPGATVSLFPVAGGFPAMAIVSSADYALVFLSGTANFQQIAMQALTTLSGPTPVDGFSTLFLWNTFANLVFNRLLNAGVSDPTPIFIAGHSYGAVSAALIAARIRAASPARQVALLTFGLPKPGDIRLIRLLAQVRAVHVANRGDLVPHLPPNALECFQFPLIVNAALAALWSQWAQGDPWILIDANGDEEENLLPSLPGNVLAPIITAAVLGDPIPTIGPHLIGEYIRRMAIRCNNPRWPLTLAAWQILFGQFAFPGAGVRLGGRFGPPAVIEATAAVLLGGVSDSSELVEATAAVLLGAEGGGSFEPDPHGGIVLGG